VGAIHIDNSNGNVGVGATSPGAKLDVAGASLLANNTSIDPDAFTNRVVAGAIADGSGWALTSAIGGNAGTGHSWAIGSNGSNLYFGYQNGTANDSMQTFMQVFPNRNVALVPTSGNVGIGTTVPGAKLHIYTGSGDMLYIQGSTGGSGNTAGIQFKTYSSPSGSSYPTAAIRTIDDGTYSSHITFLTKVPGADTNSLSERVRITSSGNVGIGTTAPGYKLHIYDNTNDVGAVAQSTLDSKSAYLSAYNSGGSSGNYIQIRAYGGTTGSTLFGISTNKMNSIWSNYDSIFTLGTLQATPLVFGTNNLERMRIDSSGNVGIGLTNPRTKTHIWSGEVGAGVQEVLRLEGNWVSAPSGPLLRFTNQHDSGTNPNSGEYNLGGIAGVDDNSNWGGSLAFYTVPTGTAGGGNLTERMRILHNGNVGIGTTAPYDKLHVYGGGLRISNGAFGANGFVFEQNGTSGHLNIRYKNPTDIYSEIMTLGYNGNVGIGTTSPARKLHVMGGNITVSNDTVARSDIYWDATNNRLVIRVN
jgi:hypothetical protein